MAKDKFLDIQQVSALVVSKGVGLKAFWEEAAGGDRVPMSTSTAMKIIRSLKG